MDRDFTRLCCHKFYSLIETIADNYWCGLPDWLDGNTPFLAPSLSELLANWGDVLGETAKMELYYKDLLDRHHASKERIQEIFENISSLDRSFANDTPGHFGSCRKRLDNMRQYIKALNQTVFAGTTPPAKFCGLANYFSPTSVNIIIEKMLFRLQVHNLSTLQSPQFTASTFYTLSSEEKAAYVAQCDELCPGWAENFSKIFSDPDWTEQEKLDIKFLIYCAPEPYRSVYLKYATQYKIIVFQLNSSDSDDNMGSCYYFKEEQIYLLDGDASFRYNERGPYYSFFHECGHALDDYAHTGDGLSCEYKTNGQALYNCIVADVRNYVSDVINNKYKDTLTQEQKNALLISLNLSDDASFIHSGNINSLPEWLKGYHIEIQEIMKENLHGAVNAAASDIYGGVTNIAIRGTYGHMFQGYWYDENGTTKKQALELWGEFFAAQMVRNEEILTSIKTHFPTAYPMLEEMALKIASY